MKCPQCGKTTPFVSGSFCRNCGAFIAPSTNQTVVPFNDPINELAIPWESNQANDAPLQALLATLHTCIFHPRRFFTDAASAHPKSIRPALLFGLITGSFGVLTTWMWGELYVKFGQSFTDYTTLFGNTFTTPSMLITTPLLMLFQFVLIGSYAGLMMRFCKCRRASFSEIIRILCYTESAAVLQLVPIAGSFASIILWLYLTLEGLHHLFAVSKMKVFFMLLLPLILLSILMVIILCAALFGGLIAGAGVVQQWESLLK